MINLKDYKRIVIYQYGKVGSRTMCTTLKKYHKNVHHMHFLGRGLRNRVQGQKNMNIISKKGTLIITIVRNVYDRNISNMFQNIKAPNNDFYFLPIIKNINLNKLMIHYRNANIKHTNRLLIPWFKKFKQDIGVDIFSKEFNMEDKYNIYKETDKTILTLRFEDIAEWEKILSNIFGIEILLESSNVSMDKAYYKLYNQFRKNYKYTKEEIQTLDTIDHLSYFYTPDEIEGFKNKYNKRL